MGLVDDASDLELRLINPAKNAFRIYGLSECVTLFGEVCLRIVWGRIGNRRRARALGSLRRSRIRN